MDQRREADYLRRLAGRERRYDAEPPAWLTRGRTAYALGGILLAGLVAGVGSIRLLVVSAVGWALVGAVLTVGRVRWDTQHRLP